MSSFSSKACGSVWLNLFMPQVETNLVDHLVELFDDFDTDKDSKL